MVSWMNFCTRSTHGCVPRESTLPPPMMIRSNADGSEGNARAFSGVVDVVPVVGSAAAAEASAG